MEEKIKSASLAEAERHIKILKEENTKLKSELASITSLYNQLVSEGKREKLDERRVTFLKSQLIQLERQLLVLNEALTSRSGALMEVENGLAGVADTCRQHLDHDKTSKVTWTRSDLTHAVETLESCRIKLYKNIDNNTSHNLVHPVKMMDRVLKSRPLTGNVTLLNVCSGSVDHLNLKHVAKLESSLSQVYQQLFGLSKTLHTVVSQDNSSSNLHISKAVYTKLGGQIAKTCKMLENVTSDLLCLSVLVPSAPWPMLNHPCLADMTADRVLASLPSFPKSKAAEGKTMIEALMKAVNYSLQMKSLEVDILNQELKLHQSIYRSQMDYTDSLIASLTEGYSSFERETHELLCKPLKDILDKYHTLSTSADEESLRKFLETFKEQSAQISTIVELFTPADSKKGAFSTFGEKFHASVCKIQRSCQTERDKKVNEIEELKQSQKEALEEICSMFPIVPQESSSNNEKLEIGKIKTAMENLDFSVSSEPESESNNSFASGKATARDRKRAAKKALHSDCSCSIDGAFDITEPPVSSPKPQLSHTATPSHVSKMPTLKRPTSLPKINAGNRSSPSSPSVEPSPKPCAGVNQSEPRRSSVGSFIPSPSSPALRSTPKGINMKKLVLIPKGPQSELPNPAKTDTMKDNPAANNI